MIVKMRSKYEEWKILNKYFGNYEMSLIFNNFSGYESVRQKNTYQEVFNELNVLI